ncbi:MAG: DUF2225 domain-containing protein [Rectinemataceae bacterium]
MAKPLAKPEKDEKERKITYAGKEEIKCPICESAFHREELFSGRVNAGNLTDELHRTYIPMNQWGEVQPLVYELTVCPSCWYSAYKGDFGAIGPRHQQLLGEGIASRIEAAERLFQKVDFGSPRGIPEGAASYYLAIMCYEHLSAEFFPTFKQALSAVRCAWLVNRLAELRPGELYEDVALGFYRKARFLYHRAMELDSSGKEPLVEVKWFGPDSDKSYGFEGVIYLSGALEFKYGPRNDPEKRAANLIVSKRSIAKLFGLGKNSKSKPGPLLEKARDLFDLIKAETESVPGADDEED